MSELGVTETPELAGFSWHVAPALLYVVVVFWLGGADLPAPVLSEQGVPVDKIGHVVAFALMQGVWFRALRYEFSGLRVELQSLLAAMTAVLLGGLLEVYQAALPQRSADIKDFLADMVGATIAAIIALRAGARVATKA